MARVSYQTLNENLVQAIKNGELDNDRLEEVRETVLEHHTKVKRAVKMLAIVLAVIYALLAFDLFVLPIIQGKTVDVGVGIFGMVFSMIPLVFLYIAYIFTHGRMTRQYNKSLKKGYPQLFDKMKI